MVLLAEARLGEMFNQMPKATTNHKQQNLEIPDAGKFLNEELPAESPKPKLEVAAEMGFNKNQVSQFQKLAANPDAVQDAIDYAEDNDTIATRKKIRFQTGIKKRQKVTILIFSFKELSR